MDEVPTAHLPRMALIQEEGFRCYQCAPERVGGAIAPDGATLAEWKAAAPDLPVGQRILCVNSEWEQLERPCMLSYMKLCSVQFARVKSEAADFYYVAGVTQFASIRAMVLAITAVTGKPVMAELAAGADGELLEDGVQALAAVGVLQRIGVSTVVFSAPQPQALAQVVGEVAPFARIPIGVVAHSDWLRADMELVNTELFVPTEHDAHENLLHALEDYKGLRLVGREHDDMLLASDGRHAHFVVPTIDISDEIACDARFGEALLDAEDMAGAIKIVLQTEDDLIAFEEHHYMITKPICLCAERAGLLEKGLRVFQGRSLYDGTWPHSDEVLRYFEQRYGMIRL